MVLPAIWYAVAFLPQADQEDSRAPHTHLDPNEQNLRFISRSCMIPRKKWNSPFNNKTKHTQYFYRRFQPLSRSEAALETAAAANHGSGVGSDDAKGRTHWNE